MTQHNEANYSPEIGYLIYRKCTPTWFMYEQVIHGWNLTYVTAGSTRYTIDGKRRDAKPGDLICLPPGTIRAGVTLPGSLMECFSADFDLLGAGGESTSMPFPIISHVGVKNDIVQMFHELVFSWMEKQPGFALKVRGLFLLILHRFMELTIFNVDSLGADPRVRKVTRYVSAHYQEKLTLQAMAAMVGLNAVYLGSLFKRETGLGFNQYVTRIRVRNAEDMLRSGEYKVAEVAELCGFSDVFHFDKRFKAVTGFAPSQCIR